MLKRKSERRELKGVIKNRTDFITGVVMIGFCLLVISQMGELPFEVSLFPKIVMLIGIGIGIAVVAKAIVKSDDKTDNKKFLSVSFAEMGILLWILAVLLLATKLGLFTATYLVTTTISLYVSHCRDELTKKKVVFAIVYNAVIVAVLYILFKAILGIRTPDGIFI